MGREAGVFAGKDSALIGDKLPEEIRVLVVQGIDGEIDLGLRTRCPPLCGCAATTPFGVPFLRMGFARHKILFNFAMKCVPAEGWIVFPDLELLRFQLFIAAGHVTGGRFAFLARFSALDGDSFAWHKNSLTPNGLRQA